MGVCVCVSDKNDLGMSAKIKLEKKNQPSYQKKMKAAERRVSEFIF